MKITGELLKAERLKKDLTVQDIAQALKLSARTITLIEAGDLDQLPSKTFVRGFVKGYADYLKIDSDLVMKQFQEEMGTTHPVPKVPPPGMKTENKKVMTARVSDNHLSKKNIVYFSVVTILVLLVVAANKIISHYQNEVIAESITQNQTAIEASNEVVSAASVPLIPEEQLTEVAASQTIQSASQPIVAKETPKIEETTAIVTKPSEMPAVKSKAQPVEILIEAKKDGIIEYAKGNTSDFKKISLKANTYQILKSASGLHLKTTDGSLFNITVNGINKGSMSTQNKSVEMTF